MFELQSLKVEAVKRHGCEFVLFFLHGIILDIVIAAATVRTFFCFATKLPAKRAPEI